MKEWWNNLALREKQTLMLGLSAFTLFLIYFFLWSPLEESITQLRLKVKNNQELLVWMQGADKQIHALEHSAAQPTSAHSSGSLLTIVQKQINRTSLVSSLKKLHQQDNDSVQLAFEKVGFDQLVKWLIQVSQLEGLEVSQISVKPTDKIGIVDMTLVLKK